MLPFRHCPGISYARKQPPTAKRSYQDDSADLIRLDSDNKEGEHEGNEQSIKRHSQVK